jgi:hypothetical protein
MAGEDRRRGIHERTKEERDLHRVNAKRQWGSPRSRKIVCHVARVLRVELRPSCSLAQILYRDVEEMLAEATLR